MLHGHNGGIMSVSLSKGAISVFDAFTVKGGAESPVYLWVHGGQDADTACATPLGKDHWTGPGRDP